MNCAECRENLVAWMEGLLDHEESLQCQEHLESCAACRAEQAAVTRLQRRLVARGELAAEVSLVQPVMRRVHEVSIKPESYSIMSILFTRWGLGLSAAAVAVTVALISFLSTPKIQAAVVEVMTKGAQAAAKLTTIHLRGRLRTSPQDNFSYINPDLDFATVELWKQFEPERKWRVENPGRIALMDGKSTLLFIKPDYAFKFNGRSARAFDTGWLHEMADLNRTLEKELSAIKAHGWPATLKSEQGADGKPKSVITIEAKSGLLTGDYLKNKFFGTADTRRVYVFDNESERLDSVSIYIHGDSGEKLIFELEQIDYNQQVDPSVFQLQLPPNVVWEQEMEILPDNEKYVAMTADQAARAYFEACSREDWNEVAKFDTVTGSLKEYLGGIEVISIGKPFTSAFSLIIGAQFVPYEIKFKNGEIKKHNLGLKRDRHTQRWFIDGGI